MRVLTEKYREEGMDIINMGLVDLMIRKTFPPLYQARFNTECSGKEVSYMGARDTVGERIKDPKKLGMQIFIKEYDDLKKDDIDPTALFNSQKLKQFIVLRKGYKLLGKVVA